LIAIDNNTFVSGRNAFVGDRNASVIDTIQIVESIRMICLNDRAIAVAYTILDFRFWTFVSLSRTILDWQSTCIAMVLQNEVIQVQAKMVLHRKI
jgi:hypothetical protein